MTIENASSFFAWDVSAYLALFLSVAFMIVIIDQLFGGASDLAPTQKKKSFVAKWFYFVCFLKFNKSEKYLGRPKLVQWSAEFYPVLLLVFLLRGFMVEPFRIPSNSMMPTLLTGDFILVSKFDYGISLPILNKKIIEFKKPERGDVIVFRYPNYEKTANTKVLTLLSVLLLCRAIPLVIHRITCASMKKKLVTKIWVFTKVWNRAQV